MSGPHDLIIDYAIRYCLTRRSYAFGDGLDLAEQHWDQIQASTRRDVIDALAGPMGAHVDWSRHPRIAAQFAIDHGITS